MNEYQHYCGAQAENPNIRLLQLPKRIGHLRVHDTILPLYVIVNDNTICCSYVTCSIDGQLQRPPNLSTSTREKHLPCANIQISNEPQGPKVLDNTHLPIAIMCDPLGIVEELEAG